MNASAVRDDDLSVPRRGRLASSVTDDDPAVRRSLCWLLRPRYDVAEACNGAEVVARVLAGEQFDAILMDLEMPIMNGQQALEELTVIAPWLVEKTFIVTGGASTPDRQHWLSSLDPGRVYEKPVDLVALMTALDGLAPTRSASSGPRRLASGVERIPSARVGAPHTCNYPGASSRSSHAAPTTGSVVTHAGRAHEEGGEGVARVGK